MTYLSLFPFILARIIFHNRQTFSKLVRSSDIMLRIIYHTTLTLLLLLSTIGIRASQHFCGSKLISTSFFSEADSCCPDKGTDNCCHNETKIFQNLEGFYLSDSLNLVSFFVANTAISYNFEHKQQYTSIYDPAYSVNKHGPPLPQSTQLALLQTYLNWFPVFPPSMLISIKGKLCFFWQPLFGNI